MAKWTAVNTPIDLMGELAINWFGTGMAASRKNLRLNMGAADSPWTDFRFISGGGALLAGAMLPVGKMGRRLAYDYAGGSLHSFVATETVRAAAKRRAEQGGGTAQIQQQAAPQGRFGPPQAGEAAASFAEQFMPGAFA
jgi:hypothetical protein